MNKVFFTASHAIVRHHDRLRPDVDGRLHGRALRPVPALGICRRRPRGVAGAVCLWEAAGRLYFGPGGGVKLSDLPHWIVQAFAKDQYGLPVFANLILVAMPVIFICALLAYRQRGPVLILLGLFTAMPVHSGLTHWYKSEQRNHWFGYWFGHDMFTPPFGVYPEMTRNSILFGGTDPGRFCPTYMIFCESFIPHNVPAVGIKNLTAATFISSRKTRWPTARIWITSARNTSAARSKTRRSSANL
jgi:hypothetical protein